jgi:hypothetical protein
METQNQLFPLMEAAEQQQKAVQKAIDGLAAERLAMAQVIPSINRVTDNVESAGMMAIQTIKRGAAEAVDAGVTAAMTKATRPAVEQLTSVVSAAHQAEASMRNAGQWFAWKWVAVAAGGMLALVLTAWLTLLWPLYQITELTAEVAQLQANANDLAKRGGRIVLHTCDGRLCVEVAKDGREWHDTKTGTPLAIVRGY